MRFNLDYVEVPKLKKYWSKAGVYYSISADEVYPDAKAITSLMIKDYVDVWKAKVGDAVVKETLSKSTANSKEVKENINLYLTNGDNYVKNSNDRTIELFNLFRPYLDKISNIKLHNEVVYNDELCIAGNIECIALFNGVPSIISFRISLHDKIDEWLHQYHCESFALVDGFNAQFDCNITNSVIINVSQDGDAMVSTSTTKEHCLVEFNNFREVLFENGGI